MENNNFVDILRTKIHVVNVFVCAQAQVVRQKPVQLVLESERLSSHHEISETLP